MKLGRIEMAPVAGSYVGVLGRVPSGPAGGTRGSDGGTVGSVTLNRGPAPLTALLRGVPTPLSGPPLQSTCAAGFGWAVEPRSTPTGPSAIATSVTATVTSVTATMLIRIL